MKNIFFMIALAVALFLSVVIFLFFFFNSREEDELSLKLPVPSLEDEKMQIRTKEGKIIKVNNLYKKGAREISLSEDDSMTEIIISDNEEYFIAYYPKDSGFIVSLYGKDLKVAREKAEETLLRELGISQNEACELELLVGVPRYADENLAGKDLGLSFCPGGKLLKN